MRHILISHDRVIILHRHKNGDVFQTKCGQTLYGQKYMDMHTYMFLSTLCPGPFTKFV